MFNISKTQLLLILAGVFVGILLYLAPRSKDSGEVAGMASAEMHVHKNEAGEAEVEEGFTFKDTLLQRQFALLDAEVETAPASQKTVLYDSLIGLSIANNIPPLVGKYAMDKAEAFPTAENWKTAGDYYLKAFRLSKNQNESFVRKAINAYEKAQKLQPEDPSIQVAMGVAYVEGAAALGEMPMKGIGMLKEVENKYPENVEAIINLGYFAIQSGQLDKAIERFNQVLEIEPDNAEAYLYLTDVYLQQDEVAKGIETLKKYKSKIDDPLVKQQVDQYIDEIQSKN
jgi:tetratricopeptide (TPR) repeat protein